MSRLRLIRRREELGLTQEQVAHKLGISPKSYARYEWGESLPRVGNRPPLARILEWTPAELSLALREDGDAPASQVVPESLTLYGSLEQGATRLWAWEPVTIHGLLQTPAYATAVESAAGDSTAEGVAERVRARMTRQRVLNREPDPLHLSVVLDESVLYRVTGGHAVMAAQLDHLSEMEQRPNVEMRILPLSAGVHIAGWGTFTVLAKVGAIPHVVCEVNGTGVRYDESPYTVETHRQLFDDLVGLALPTAESADLVRTTAKERYRP